jgi:formylglycine-generating enzyme required for sulfatase activity
VVVLLLTRTAGCQDFLYKIAGFTTLTEIITEKGFDQEEEGFSQTGGHIESMLKLLRHRRMFPKRMWIIAAVLLGTAAPATWSQEQCQSAEKGTILDMVLVQGGTFQMGDIFGDGNSGETPVHTVTVSSFFMSKYEVTMGQFSQFVGESGYLTTAERMGGWLVWTGTAWERKFDASWKNPYFTQAKQEPVVMVSWNDAVVFCNWLSHREKLTPFYKVSGTGVTENWSADGYRLPTEAEWEYAARGGGRVYKYSWGNGGPEGNVADESLKKAFNAWPFAIWSGYWDGYIYTAPVGSFQPNELGLYDMSGNVWEWCNDWYGSYAAGEQMDPKGPPLGVTRLMHGGGWTDAPAALRDSYRGGRIPDGRGVNSGFRPVRSAMGQNL